MHNRLFSWSAVTLSILSLSLVCACKSATAPLSSGSVAQVASPTSADSSTTSADGPPISAEERLSGKEAMDYVRYQMGLGIRPAGSDASRTLAQDFQKRTQAWGYRTELQNFTAQTPHGPLAMRNVIATWPGERPERFIVAAHYDTKVFRDFTFVGANDGASGTAVILELGHALSKAPLRHTLQLVLLDGEEALESWSKTDSLYGSRHFVHQLVDSGEDNLVRGVIILDMVGDKNMLITQELNSDPALRQTMNQAAAALKLSQHFPKQRAMALDDDHRPFLEAGLPALDIIGLYLNGAGKTEPAYWHTAEDTLDKISQSSLGASGSLTLRMLRMLDQQE